MEINDKINILFNSYKIKYDILRETFVNNEKNEKKIYFYIDFNYLFNQFLDIIDYDHMYQPLIIQYQTTLITEFLNLISHYKSFFYKYLDSISFFYVGIDISKYKNDSNISDMIKWIKSIILMIPRIYIIETDSEENLWYFKYNLFKIIAINRQTDKNIVIFFDLFNNYRFQLFYMLNKNYYIFTKDDFKIKLYNFNNFLSDYFPEIDALNINKLLSIMDLLTIIRENNTIMSSNNIDNIINKYFVDNPLRNYNDINTKKNILSIMKNKPKYIDGIYNTLFNQLNNLVYYETMKILMKSWKNTIHDKNIYKINELLNIPHDKRINIENLMNY